VAIIAALPAHRLLAWLPFKNCSQQNENFDYQFYVLAVIEPIRNMTRIFYLIYVCTVYTSYSSYFVVCYCQFNYNNCLLSQPNNITIKFWCW